MDHGHALLASIGLFALLPTSQSGLRPQGRSLAATTPAVAAANELFAAPWAGLGAQYERDTEESVERSLEGARIAHGSGKVKELGLEWRAVLEAKDVAASLDLSSPPAFREASSRGFVLDLPRDGWSSRSPAS